MKLTKKTIDKLNNAPFDTRIWNGNFAIAEVEISNNKKRYTLRYELSHPDLEMFSGQRDKAEFIVWQGHSGVHGQVPEDLNELVGRAKASAQVLLDQKVGELFLQNWHALAEFKDAFCLR